MSCRGGFDLAVRAGGQRWRWRVHAPWLLTFLVWPAAARAQSAPPSAYAPPPGSAPAGSPATPTTPWVTPYAPPGAYPGAAWGPPIAAPPAPRWVYVDLRTDNPRVRIDRVLGSGRVPVCFAPCRKMLDASGVYVIDGDGVRNTSQFMLPDDRNTVTLDVQAGSSARLAGGALLVGAGVAASYIGLLVWEASTLGEISDSSTTNASGGARVGETMIIVGIPAALLGLYFAVTSHTSVTSSTGATFTRETPERHGPWIAFTPRGLEF